MIDFKGMTAPAEPDYVGRCPDACTEKRCVISTVGSCKHPYKTGDAGCGPITMANRVRARKFLGAVPKPLNHGDAIR